MLMNNRSDGYCELTKNRLQFESPKPAARVYHTASIWGSADRKDMVLVFGGRSVNGESLNDLWGLRRHANGQWDWQQAPSRSVNAPPIPRSQHAALCYKNLFLAIGGKGQNPDENLSLEIFNLAQSEWYKLGPINRFRHASWIMGGKLFIHGGFEPARPTVATNNLFQIDLREALRAIPALEVMLNAGQVKSFD